MTTRNAAKKNEPAKEATPNEASPPVRQSGTAQRPKPQIVMIRPKGQVTLSAEIRAAARVEEGDPLSIELTPDGILLRPMKLIDAAQAWFWREDWQRGEREADEDLRKGRTKIHRTGKDFLDSLDD